MHWSLEFATFRRRKLSPGELATQTPSSHFDESSAMLRFAQTAFWKSAGCRSARPWSSGTECTWNPAISLPVRSTFALGAVRRLEYEAADCGLLSADLAA